MSNLAIASIVALLAAIVAGFLLTPPIPQYLAYHAFADDRTLFGISNFWDVVSNLPFLVVGVWGLVYLARHGDSVCMPRLMPAYVLLFAGIALVAPGSGYYHLAPTNETLVWDRLSISIAFAGLIAVVIGEFVSIRAARRLLLPLLVVSVGSVWYWAATEARGVGDLRAYALVQFLPVLILPIVFLRYEPAMGGKKYFWYMLLFYAAARVCELFDKQIFAFGGLLSGHTLKHLFAAVALTFLLRALAVRRGREVAAASA